MDFVISMTQLENTGGNTPMDDKVKCPKCGCEVLKEHLELDCHAHNDTNVWRKSMIGEIYEVLRTKVVEGEKDVRT